jgi:hypothetical protein
MRPISPEERARRLGNVAAILIELGRRALAEEAARTAAGPQVDAQPAQAEEGKSA